MQIAGMVVRKNREVENCQRVEEGNISGDCMDDFVKK